MINKSRFRTLVVLGLFLVVTLWITINSSFRVGSVYTLVTLVSIAMYSMLTLFKHDKNLPDVTISASILIGMIGSLFTVMAVFFLPTQTAMITPISITSFIPSVSIPSAVYGFSNFENLFYVTVIASIAEEIFFRGWLLSLLRLFLGNFASILVVNIVFSLYHMMTYGMTMISYFLGAFMFGVIMSMIVIATKNLASPILIHASNNFARYVKDNSLFMFV